MTECLVFGARAGNNAVEFSRGSDEGNEAGLRGQAEEEAERIAALRKHRQGSEKISTVRRELNVTMEEGCGVYREQASMDATVRTVASLRDRVKDVRVEDGSMVFNTELIAALELVNMVDIAEAVAQSAAVRNESRGAHTRKDFPQP